MEPIHFFRAGVHTDLNGKEVSFCGADLETVTHNYNPATHEAPLVVGHPAINGPAYGWVKSVEARPDGLYAVPSDVQPEFAELVRSGAYKKVSGSFYVPGAKNNPSPGGYYLRHIGFLGAAAPAVKGLKPVSFSADTDALDFQESTLDLREHRLAVWEAALAARELNALRGNDAEFVDSVIRQGRLPIGLKDMAVALFAELGDNVVQFGEGNDREASTPRKLLRDMLSHLPLPVVLEELSGGPLPPEDAREFAAPEGYGVDPGSLELYREVLAYQKEHKCSFIQALMALTTGRN